MALAGIAGEGEGLYAQQQQMIPQQLARIVEETVNNIRELDSRLEVLRTDLALLCQTIGLPEAAHKVLTSRVTGHGIGTQGLGTTSPFTQSAGQPGQFGQAGYGQPTGAPSPFGNVGFGQQPGVPGQFGGGQSPFQGPLGNPWSGVWGQNPQQNPQQNPYGSR